MFTLKLSSDFDATEEVGVCPKCGSSLISFPGGDYFICAAAIVSGCDYAYPKVAHIEDFVEVVE